MTVYAKHHIRRACRWRGGVGKGSREEARRTEAAAVLRLRERRVRQVSGKGPGARAGSERTDERRRVGGRARAARAPPARGTCRARRAARPRAASPPGSARRPRRRRSAAGGAERECRIALRVQTVDHSHQ